MYNIFQYYENYFNLLINKVKRKKGIKTEYQVNQAHLIRKLKKILTKNDPKPNTPHNKTLYQKNNKILPKITKQKNKKTHNTQKPQKTTKIQHKLQTNIKKMKTKKT